MKFLAKVTVGFAAAILTFAVLEPFFRLYLRNLNLSLQESLETCARPLAQISKKGLEPRDYTAIVGDSYAEGAGDWYLRSDRRKHLPYQAAHLLHEWTGQDIVTFGSSGTGPLRYVLINLPSSYIYINALWFQSLERPKNIIVYFYEGNDVSDTLKILQRNNLDTLDPDSPADQKRLEEFLERYEKNEIHMKRATRFSVFYNLQSAVFVARSVVNLYKLIKDGSQFPREPTPPGTNYKVSIGSDLMPIPDGLHWPELHRSEREIRLGVLAYKQCILRLRSRFPDAKYGIVYIPSPYSVYRFAEDDAHKASREFGASVFRNSDMICSLVRQVADDLGIPFVDTRPRLRENARREIIHGPYDWKHFNRRGYEIFAEDLLSMLNTLKGVGISSRSGR